METGRQVSFIFSSLFFLQNKVTLLIDLHVTSHRYKSWKRRWFILNDNCLYYFEYTTDKEPRGIIPLENIRVREIQDRSKPHCFELYACGGADIIKACKTDSEGKVVEGKHSVYRMSAATDEDKQEWIKCLTQSISHNPFYDILVQRKKKALTSS